MNKAKFLKKGILVLLMSFIFVINTKQAEATETVDINNASTEELQKITGVGPVIAQRIIDARPYTSLDDLKRVKGIGDVTLQKIKQQGIAYASRKEVTNIQYTVYYFLVTNVVGHHDTSLDGYYDTSVPPMEFYGGILSIHKLKHNNGLMIM